MWLKLCVALAAILSLFSFLMSVDRPALLILGYVFGVVFVILYEAIPPKPNQKDTST